jgi:hypothetical protein
MIDIDGAVPASLKGGMDGNKRRRAVRNAGAFLAPNGTFPVPMRTLSDDYQDLPADSEDDQVPEPELPSVIRRLVDRLVRGFGRRR